MLLNFDIYEITLASQKFYTLMSINVFAAFLYPQLYQTQSLSYRGQIAGRVSMLTKPFFPTMRTEF